MPRGGIRVRGGEDPKGRTKGKEVERGTYHETRQKEHCEEHEARWRGRAGSEGRGIENVSKEGRGRRVTAPYRVMATHRRLTVMATHGRLTVMATHRRLTVMATHRRGAREASPIGGEGAQCGHRTLPLGSLWGLLWG